MTPLHLDDEALSAAVDGEATADEQAHLDACPACRERLVSLRTVALAVGAPVNDRPDAAVEAAIVAALAGADEREDGHVPAPTAAVPISIGQRRSVPISGGTRLFTWVLAAAAVLVVVMGVGLLARSHSSSSKSSSLASRAQAPAPLEPPTAKASGSPAGAAVNPKSPASNFAPGVSAAQSSLGDQSDARTLAAIVDAQLQGLHASADQSTDATNSLPPSIPQLCVDQGATAVGMAGIHPALRYVAPVRWQGQNGTVLVFVLPSGGFAGAVMRLSDCTTLTTLHL